MNEEEKEKLRKEMQKRMKENFKSSHYCPYEDREVKIEEMTEEENYKRCNICLLRGILINTKMLNKLFIGKSAYGLKQLKKRDEKADDSEYA